jgi:hypothetical protein
MDQRLPMVTKTEIMKARARDYGRTANKVKGKMLVEPAATVGWYRANDRRQLRAVDLRKGPASAVKRHPPR